MSEVPTPQPAPEVAPRKKRSRLLLAASLALPGLAAAGALALYWGLKTEPGTVWLLQQVPGLQVEAPQGPLLGDFSARRLRYQSPGFSIDMQDLRWQGLSLAWERTPLLWGRLEIKSLQARRLTLGWSDSPASTEPCAAPQDLALPLAVQITDLRVDEVHAPALGAQPLRDLRAGVWLAEQEGLRHRIALQNLAWDKLSLSGQAQVQTTGAMKVDLQALLRSGERWQAQASLTGPLDAPALQASAETAGQALKLKAALRPFARWPLHAAELNADKFDLAALHSGLPSTALSGHARLKASAWDQPAHLLAELRNAAAGRWDQQRLPVHSLKLDLQARPDHLQSLQDLSSLKVDVLEAQLGSAGAPAGRLSAQGTGLQLQARVSELRSAGLDARLPALRLSGRVDLKGQLGKLPRLDLDGRLNGDWQQTAKLSRPVELQLRANSDGRQIELQQALLQSGASRLDLKGQVLPASGAQGWSAKLSAGAKDFDPRLLWAGEAGSGWAKGQHSLDATLQAELRQGPDAWPLGTATLQLQPSLLAGVGLDGQINYQASGKAKPELQLELGSADNRLRLSAQGGTAPQGRAEIAAPKLAVLTPLLTLWAPQAQLNGGLQGTLAISGKDGGGNTSGRLDVKALQLKNLPGLDSLRLDGATLDWQLDSRLDAPLRAQAQLKQLSLNGSLISQAQLDLQGSWARHQLKLDGLGYTPTPAWAASVADPAGLSGSLLLALNGQLSASPWLAWQQARDPVNWQVQASRLLLRPTRSEQPDWVSARDVKLSLQLGTSITLQQADLAPGRIELAGAGLRWSQIQWLAARDTNGQPQLSAELELEPLAVAPLLARWQPDFGWGGKLVMGGRARVRSAPQVEVDIALSRAGGDLTVTDEAGVQALGLSELRLGLLASGGVWHFTQAVAGSNLGVLGGAITSRTSPQALWPAPDAPLEGVLQANVENLSTWGSWVPTGWRLGGSFNAGVQLAGKVGAPEIIGQANGAQIALRNPLLGVDVRDGEFALRLDGSTATLERLSARGGDGKLSAQGRALLGDKPELTLSMTAERFAALSRVDRRLSASGQASLKINREAFSLDGRFNVDEGLFDFSRGDAPSLDDDVQVLRPDRAVAEAGRARASGRAPKIDVQLALDLGRQLRIKGRGLDTRLRGELKLVHQGAGPTLTGVLRTFGGTYDAYGQRLDIERGEITFAGVVDNPRLNVLAVRPNTDIRVGVTLTGTALNPRIKLFSEPDMGDTDKLSWLLLGRAPDGLGRTDTALLQRAALALLSGEGESTSGKLIKNLGLDELSLSQGEDDSRGTIVRLGKNISRRWYLGYERGLNATTGSWQLIYRIARRFTLRAQAGEESAVDLIWQWKWE
ncbi:translocation/assembly module TamB domain-containing protein [Paucibacter sp. PLA-PC-4]|uniref:translocation/assembly module TamB domain-containing protein n=1 Tax=Paucibacter sp. PLA-PC-4 TaxID=2993655 RepID=UPI00224B9B73|nr:translocation/assembly module TamB domain-containing protein [Paucibacter sp. PLA-PC-4]MCX2863739.1 translocation/assembly module TamB domain-containing protein [Paucibacter sp. PLA-PC-4]